MGMEVVVLSSAFFASMVRTPFSNLADIFSVSTGRGSQTVLVNWTLRLNSRSVDNGVDSSLFAADTGSLVATVNLFSKIEAIGILNTYPCYQQKKL